MNQKKVDMSIVIAGLGNLLLGDDGFGVHVIQRMQNESPPIRAHLLEVGTCALHFQEEVEQADGVIAIDAVQAGGEPGTIYVFELDQSTADSNQHFSLHDLGVAGLLSLIEPSRRPRVIAVGVEPERLDLTTDLSPTVEKALPGAIEIVHVLSEALHRGICVDLKEILANAKIKTMAC